MYRGIKSIDRTQYDNYMNSIYGEGGSQMMIEDASSPQDENRMVVYDQNQSQALSQIGLDKNILKQSTDEIVKKFKSRLKNFKMSKTTTYSNPYNNTRFRIREQINGDEEPMYYYEQF